VNSTSSCETCMVGSPEEIRTPVSGSRAAQISARAHWT